MRFDPSLLLALSCWFVSCTVLNLDVAMANSFGQIEISPYTESHGVAAGDVDGDGDADIVYSTGDTGALRWMENVDGDGMNWRHHTIQADGERFWRSWSLRVYDMDGDGVIDVITGGTGVTEPDQVTQYEVNVWVNNGVGSFARSRVDRDDGGVADAPSLVIYDAQLSDIDGDGDLDLSFADLHTVGWYENESGDATTLGPWGGSATDGTHSTLRHEFGGMMDARSALPVDLDGDGVQEIVGASYSDYAANAGAVMAFDAYGFGRTSLLEGVSAWGLMALDADGDGDMDVAMSYGHTWLLENVDGEGQTWSATALGEGGYTVIAADMDDDGDSDLVASNGVWYANDGDGVFDAQTIGNTEDDGATRCVGVAPADLDGDGDLDLVASHLLPGYELFWWGQGEDDYEAGDPGDGDGGGGDGGDGGGDDGGGDDGGGDDGGGDDGGGSYPGEGHY